MFVVFFCCCCCCVLQYYDTEHNLCHSLDLNSSDNAVYLTELSTANPADRELMTSLLASVDGEKVVCALFGALPHYYVMKNRSTSSSSGTPYYPQ